MGSRREQNILVTGLMKLTISKVLLTLRWVKDPRDSEQKPCLVSGTSSMEDITSFHLSQQRKPSAHLTLVWRIHVRE